MGASISSTPSFFWGLCSLALFLASFSIAALIYAILNLHHY